MTLILRILAAVASRMRAVYYRALGVRIAGKVWLRAIEIPRQHGSIALAEEVALDRGVVLLASDEAVAGPKIEIGRGTYINRYTIIDASRSIRIGAQCMVGPHVYITDHDHAAAPGQAPGAGPLIAEPTVIEERCWIGAHASILKGVTIGAGSIVGAGSVVTRSLPAGVVAAGNPARVIRAIEPRSE